MQQIMVVGARIGKQWFRGLMAYRLRPGHSKGPGVSLVDPPCVVEAPVRATEQWGKRC